MSGRSVRGRGGGRGGRGGRFAPGMRPVDESTRIDIASALADFQASDETELTFPPGLSNHDRAVVHAECKKYGFSSKSFGKGEGRAVTVFKRRERAAREPIFELPLGETSLSQLNAYFNAYPPTESELASATQGLDQAYGDGNRDSSSDSGGSSNDEEEEEDVVFNQGGISKESKKDKKKKNAKSGKKEVKNADQQPYGTTTTTSSKNNNNNRYSRGKHAAEFSTTEIESRRTKWENSISKDSMRDLISGRHTLPIASYREEIVSAVRNNQVILIAGETGCGKTTQVPQYLVEDAWHRGKGCRVVCTQPRRISAMSVAERVAAERGETIGDNVGYTIRLESRGGTESSLMFCTNGILLRMLTDQSHDAMARVTHLVIDEIHERDRFADFLLILVRDLLPAHPHLRVVLMSATLHVELFSGYFGGCPVVRVPGFTHPVQDFYLEDVLKLIGYESAAVQEMDAALGGQGRGAAALVAAGGRGRGRGRGASNKQYYSGGGENNNSETRAEAAARDVSSSSRLSKEEKSQIEAAIEAAFRTGDDDAFELLMEVTGAAGADDIETGSPGVNVQHSTTGATALVAAAFHGRTDVASVLLANGADPSIETNNGMNARACAAQCNRTDIVELLDEWEEQARAADELASSALALSHYQSNTDADEVDLDLIEALLSYICGEGKFSTENKNRAEESQQGAVLIFFPGWDEIIRMKEKLESSPIFGRSTRYSLLPLHSMVAPQDQRKVFLRPPPGVRKIVMSTNMAETAITIDDVVCVIDSGRLKEKSYDAFTGVSTLQGAWISRASEKQRRGRAGRCQPGVAFHMYSRQRSEALAEFQLPELKRSPLDEMSLQVKLLETPSNTVTIGSFLAKAVEPPVPQAVDAAVALLGDIGALDSNEKLTTLGRHLAALPLPPALGKMLLYGVLYRCLDPVLTVACCMAYRDPWVLPANPGGKFEAAMLRGQWSTEAGGSSDHLSTVKAFNGWVAAKQRGGDHHYCVKNYLSAATMRMIDGMRTQLLGELVGRGFVRSIEDASTEGHRADLVRAVLGCGFYPMIGRVIPIASRDSKTRTSVVTRAGDKVRIHPASVNSKLKVEKPEQLDYYTGTPAGTNDDEDLVARRPSPPATEFAALLFFDEITRGDSMLYIKSCTAMHPHPVILVAAHVVPAPDTEMDRSNQEERRGGEDSGVAVEVQSMQSMQLGEIPNASINSSVLPDTGLLIVDGWLKFRVQIQTIAQLSCLRLRVASAFAAKVNRPNEALPPKLQKAMDVSAAMFINESESGDGVETDLGCSYRVTPNPKNNAGGREYGARGGGGGGRYTNRGGFSGGNHSHHLFRYSHHAPAVPPHQSSGGGGSSAFSGRSRGRGRGATRKEEEEEVQGRSYEYRGGPYAQSTYSEYDDRHGGGLKRSHSGNPREHQSFSRGGRGGGRSYGRYGGNGSYQHRGRGRGGGSVGGRGGGGY